MRETKFMKNIQVSLPLTLVDLVDYQEGQVVSRTFVQNKAISLTLFAFWEEEGLTTHTAAGDAFVQILDGEATITIGSKKLRARTGEIVVMPANVPHSLHAHTRFKMLLTVIKGD